MDSGYLFHMSRTYHRFRCSDFRQDSLVCAVTFLAFALLPCADRAPSQTAPAAERTYDVPCEVTSFAHSGDGTTIWFACQDQTWKRWQQDAAEARAKGEPPPPRVTSHSRTVVYALDVPSGLVVKLTDADGGIYLAAAPMGKQVVLTLPQKRGHGQPVLFDCARRVAELPIDPSFLVWSSDASKIYFYGGSTIQADAWGHSWRFAPL